jgi:multiple sugar transport system substrate-binding protein
VRWRRPRPLAWASVVALVAVVVLAGCGGRAPSGGGGGGSEGGTLTLWTHNAGNPQQLGVVKQIVSDYNASQTKNQVKIQAFPQATYNDAVTAAATARKLPCVLDVDAPIVPNWAWAGYLAKLDLPQDLVGKQLPSTLGKWKDRSLTASGADQSVYVLPLAAHGVAAGAIVLIARWRAAALVH